MEPSRLADTLMEITVLQAKLEAGLQSTNAEMCKFTEVAGTVNEINVNMGRLAERQTIMNEAMQSITKLPATIAEANVNLKNMDERLKVVENRYINDMKVMKSTLFASMGTLLTSIVLTLLKLGG